MQIEIHVFVEDRINVIIEIKICFVKKGRNVIRKRRKWSAVPIHQAFFNSLPNKPMFLAVCSTSLLKTLWTKEKFLVTRNFSIACNE